ncbi:hypothetical protein VN97_g834 [Penicillium thymicola]|uniref:Uncharacterized protein n=1 Tax=Penicillium thymicola TaxID=293382 RepID=A0AAI9TSP6_PENTH|nr:hypothetical protein VN97_g834 [Penicillium thymicola]
MLSFKSGNQRGPCWSLPWRSVMKTSCTFTWQSSIGRRKRSTPSARTRSRKVNMLINMTEGRINKSRSSLVPRISDSLIQPSRPKIMQRNSVASFMRLFDRARDKLNTF